MDWLVLFAQTAVQAPPPASPTDWSNWIQGGAFGALMVVIAWIGKSLIPTKDAQYKLLLDTKDAQLAKKDEALEKKDLTLLDVIKARSAEREKESDKFVMALSMIGDKFQAAMLRCEQDHDKRDSAWEARIEKLVTAFALEGKESREHLRREREAEAELHRVERDQREKEQTELREAIARLTAAVEGQHAGTRD